MEKNIVQTNDVDIHIPSNRVEVDAWTVYADAGTGTLKAYVLPGDVLKAAAKAHLNGNSDPLFDLRSATQEGIDALALDLARFADDGGPAPGEDTGYDDIALRH